jgi:hypothetical protein
VKTFIQVTTYRTHEPALINVDDIVLVEPMIDNSRTGSPGTVITIRENNQEVALLNKYADVVSALGYVSDIRNVPS